MYDADGNDRVLVEKDDYTPVGDKYSYFLFKDGTDENVIWQILEKGE